MISISFRKRAKLQVGFAWEMDNKKPVITILNSQQEGVTKAPGMTTNCGKRVTNDPDMTTKYREGVTNYSGMTTNDGEGATN